MVVSGRLCAGVVFPVWSLVALSLILAGCRSDAGGQADAGGDTDTDSDGDADTDTDTDTGPMTECTECPEGKICLSRVRGRLLYEDGTPVAGVEYVVKFHIKVCHVVTTDDQGYFEVFKGCMEVEEPFFMEIPSITALSPERTRYAMWYDPTREQIMDQGPDDFTFDVGDHYWWSLPDPSTTYTPGGGATVSQAGVEFEVPPGALGDEQLELGVFEFPLAEWIPPFIDSPYCEATLPEVDALYHLFPYWQMVEGDGLVLRIDPPAGWSAEDTGTVHVLGDWNAQYLELPEQGQIEIGHIAEIGPVSYEEGKLVTPPIPVLGWVMLVKD